MDFRIIFLVAATAFQPDIPRTWTDSAVAELEVPLAQSEYSPKHISEADYYRIPERVLYRTYPVYHPDLEPGLLGMAAATRAGSRLRPLRFQ